MIQKSDVSSNALIERLEPMLGARLVDILPLQNHMHLIHASLQQKTTVTMVQAVTGSGKSVLIPNGMHQNMKQQNMKRKLLVLNPSTIDTENVCKHATRQGSKSCFRMGRGQKGGDDFEESVIVFVTVGLAAKWYASHGLEKFEDYDGVFCDEFHEVETDPKYCMLWEMFRHIATQRSFLILGASATFSESLETKLNQINTCWVRCHERRYPLERNIVKVYQGRFLYPVMLEMAVAILKRKESCLMFLPGRSEIEDMQMKLINAGINAEWIAPLHADLQPHQKKRACAQVVHPKVILSTSVAETSITLPQIDHVLDSGICRTRQAYDDIISSEDFTAPVSVQTQRHGRAGRSKPGSATFFASNDSSHTRARPPISVESMQSVVALEDKHLKIQIGKLSMCPISEERSEAVRQQIKSLSLSDEELSQAVTQLPFSIRDAAVFFKSKQYYVAYEVAAVMFFKNICTWPWKKRFGFSQIVNAVAGTKFFDKDVGRLNIARAQFNDLCEKLRDAKMPLRRSRHKTSDMEEAAAVAFLACPERLVWHRDQDPACFLGEPLIDCVEQGYSVGVLFQKAGNRLQCSLHLPCTEWVFEHAKIKPFNQTAKVLSDSTVFEFRVACILQLRSLGYDTRLWRCHGGYQETQFAVDITLSRSVDLCIIFPNGNCLARQQQCREPRWVKKCADEMSTALHATARLAVAFVGDAMLSPGVQNAEVYKILGKSFFHTE